MVKKSALTKRNKVSLAVESQLVWGCTVLRANLSLVACVKGDCAAVWLFLKACLAQVIGTEAATAPRSAVLKCRGKCVAVLVVLRKETGKEMSSCKKPEWSVGSNSGLEVSMSK